MRKNLTQKLINSHLVQGHAKPGENIDLQFDQTLCQDATGTLVMLTLEAMELDQVKTLSVQYIDHNLLQEDHKNPDDHLFLHSAAQRFGLWFSRPGNGISHPLHMQRFAKPGAALLGSDSHTCAAGSMGMLAMGAGGTDVALAMAGEPITVKMPEVWGIRLVGKLPDWVSAKDVILEMLKRHGVEGGIGRVIEYYGPGVDNLSAMDRHVIANMGAELGATATVFPSDNEIKRFLASEDREAEWKNLVADQHCDYDHHDEINLSAVEPLIAKPSSPGNVVPVASVNGEPIFQSYIGSSANPGYRDFAIAAEIMRGQLVPEKVSLDINPSTRQLLQQLTQTGYLTDLLSAGARLHQAGCNGCIGMGQAPATGKNSLRTTPRNFPGRSGTKEDSVWLCSPETAAASALNGRITDPRTLAIPYPQIKLPKKIPVDSRFFDSSINTNQDKVSGDNAIMIQTSELAKGPNIVSLPETPALATQFDLPILLKLGHDISTDEILPAGAEVLPYRSNIPKISDYCFQALSSNYTDEARKHSSGHCIIAGRNYGQGSSREHAALAPRFIGLQVIVAISFARIHWQNLINFGVLPLTFDNPEDYQQLEIVDNLVIQQVSSQLKANSNNTINASCGPRSLKLKHQLSQKQREIILAGGVIPWIKQRHQS